MPPSVPLRTSPTREEARESSSEETGKKSTTLTRRNDISSSPSSTPQQTTTSTANNLNPSPLSTMGGGMYGGGMMSMYGGAGGMYGGMMGSPYGGMMAGAGPLSGLNQMLFSVQSVIFSLGQAVQIVGMNTQALHQLLDTATTMFDHALQTFKEMQTLDAASREAETEEQQKKRRRLKALRWALVMSIAYGGYRLIRRLVMRRRRHRQLEMYPAQQKQPTGGMYPPSTSMALQPYGYQSPYGGGGTYSSYGSPYSSYGGGAPYMYGGGGGHGGSYY